MQTIFLKFKLSIASDVKQTKQIKYMEPQKENHNKIGFICILVTDMNLNA